MTSNEQHLILAEATLAECAQLCRHLKNIEKIFTSTEPPRRDSSGPETAHLNLRVFKCVMQAKEAAAMLETILQRTRRGGATTNE